MVTPSALSRMESVVAIVGEILDNATRKSVKGAWVKKVEYDEHGLTVKVTWEFESSECLHSRLDTRYGVSPQIRIHLAEGDDTVLLLRPPIYLNEEDTHKEATETFTGESKHFRDWYEKKCKHSLLIMQSLLDVTYSQEG